MLGFPADNFLRPLAESCSAEGVCAEEPAESQPGCLLSSSQEIIYEPHYQMEHVAADVGRGGILPHNVQGSQGVRAPSLAVGKAAWVSLGKCFRSSTSKAGRKSPADPAL